MSDVKYVVSSTPHVKNKHESIEAIMLDVCKALLPAALCGVYFFGLRALVLIVLCVGLCVGFEELYCKIAKQPSTIRDFSAVVTGLLLAFNLPPTAPLWLPILGAFFAIVVVKQLFGGLGQNFMNPALAGRAFLLASFPTQMTAFIKPVNVFSFVSADAVTSATPLALLKDAVAPTSIDYINALAGNIGGCIGETSAIALILGGLYLLYKKVITWRVPATYIGTVFIFTFIFGRGGLFQGYPLYELLVGGLMVGAFFMATDYSSSPVTPKGQLIMGVMCGLLTGIIRLYGGYPEGVSYSILLMNLAVPLIDRFTKPRVFGTKLNAGGAK